VLNATRQDRSPWLLGLLLAVDGLHFVFATLIHAHVAPHVSAATVMCVAAAVLGVFGLITRRIDLSVFRRHWPMFLAVGALVGLSTQLNYIAVGFVNPGAASLLAQLSTVYAIGLGVGWLGERLSRWQLLGGALAIAGALIIGLQPGAEFRLGALMIVVGQFAYALHAALVKRHGGGIDLFNFMFFRVCATAFALVILATGWTAVSGVQPWFDSSALWIVPLIALVDICLSRGLYYAVLRRVPVSLMAITLTLSPVVATLWAFVLLQRVPTLQQVLGGAVVLGGIAIVRLRG
jgi:O-acetylserine/cysteine efflux transporter